jgi:uncharacterized protein YkwD
MSIRDWPHLERTRARCAIRGSSWSKLRADRPLTPAGEKQPNLWFILPPMQAPPSAQRRVTNAPRRRLVLARSRLLAALVVVSAVAAGAVQTATAAPTVSSGASGIGRLHSLEPQVLAAINDLRRAQGLAPLRLSRPLTIAAEQHSLSMAEHGYFEHSSFNGVPFWKRIEAVYPRKGRRWSVGENLVWASPGLSAQQALELWLASPPHRETLLSPAWREVGLGAVRAVAGGVYQGRIVTILTADFGVRR